MDEQSSYYKVYGFTISVTSSCTFFEITQMETKNSSNSNSFTKENFPIMDIKLV